MDGSRSTPPPVDDYRTDMTGGRVLIVGNSISISSRDGIEAYPTLLASVLGERWSVVPLTRSGATIDELEDEVINAIEDKRPDIFILQIGINECAPRPLGRRGRTRLSRVKSEKLRGLIVQFLHAYRPHIIRLRGVKQLTPPHQFANAVTSVLRHASRLGCLTLILPVTRIPRTAEERTPFTNREVARYNDILRTYRGDSVHVISEIELFGMQSPEGYCAGPDTVHLNAAAHERIAQVIADQISNTVSAKAV